MQAIKLLFDYDESFALLPLDETIENEDVETFDELKTKFEAKKWGYYSDVKVSLIDVYTSKELEELKNQTVIPGMKTPKYQRLDSHETVKCNEFDIWFYKETGIEPELYSTPFYLTPEDYFFCCYFAYDCYYGRVYSGDFQYFECSECERDICQQNPRNGYHTQFRFIDDEMICEKCYNERLLRDGSDIEEIIRTEEIQAGFFNSNDLSKHGWALYQDCITVGAGRFNSVPKSMFFARLAELPKSNDYLIDIDSMAIGGMGAEVSIYQRVKEVI